MTTLGIRPYSAADAVRLVELFRCAVRAIPSTDYSPAQLAAWAPDEIDPARFAHRCGTKSTWVAVCGSEIAGFSDLEEDGYVDMLYVHPAFQRRGVARALLGHIESLARERGLTRLYSEASITARPAFEAHGFVVVAAQAVTRRGADFTNYRMEKPLSVSPRAP